MMHLEGHQPSFSLVFDEFEEGSFREFLPFSDLNRWVEENSFLDRAATALGVWGRLGQIRALSFLSYVGPSPEMQYFTGYTHHRLDHSLVVAMVAGEIGRRNNLSQSNIKLLETAGLLHDIAIPALGDAIKSVDPENLDEEKFWHECLDDKGKKFLKDEGLDIQELDRTITNGGVPGQILDIADRLTYTMKDLYHTVDVGNKINVNPYLIEIRYPLSHHPNIGNVYKDVSVDQKKAWCFLQIRKVLACFFYFGH